MARKQESKEAGRAMNDEPSHRLDTRTDMTCITCQRRFNSAREPYVPCRCWKCWGSSAREYWRNWIREEFFQAERHNRPSVRLLQTVGKIEKVLSDQRVQVVDIVEAIDGCYMLGRERDYYEEWRKVMKAELKRVIGDIAKRGAAERLAAEEKADEPQQLKLSLFGR